MMAQVKDSKNDAPILPGWLNEEYLKNILTKDNRDNVKLNSWQIKLAHGKGENYASTIYRAELTVEDEDKNIETISYILKIAQGLEWMDNFQSGFSIFTKEFEMYDNVLPKLHQIFRDNGDETCLSPKCVISSQKPIDNLVFEDLSRKGYRMGIRQNGLDMTHMKLVLKKLAKMHAASVCLFEKEGPYIQSLQESFYKEESREFLEVATGKLFDALSKIIENEWNNGAKYAAKFMSNLKTYFTVSQKAFAFNPNDFNVLNHGDLWTNNVMFKYDETNNVEDVLFIDYQLPLWSSPAIDLWYFIISSGNIEIKAHEFDTIIQYYYENLINALTTLQYTGRKPTLVELHIDLLKRGVLAIIASTGVLPIAKLNECENADINNFFEDNPEALEFKKQLYGNPKYVDEMNILMPFFENKGFLDLLEDKC